MRVVSGEAGEETERRQRAKALIGKKLSDKWRIERLLGIGATSTVFAASHRNGHRVAVKVLHPELSFNRKVTQRFLREGYLANRVGHPGVATVIDDGVDADGTVFLVLELLNGQSLAALAARRGGTLGERELLQVAEAVLTALAAAHDKGVVHRDIKPANLFLTADGQAKVLDFGLARLRDPSAESVLLTHGDCVLGTPAYMAPEQARGAWDMVEARTDLWCLGATMFRLLTGRTVHLAQTFNQMLIATATEPAPPVRSVSPGLSDDTAAVIDRALRLDPSERWPDAAAMRTAILLALPKVVDQPPDPAMSEAAVSALERGSVGAVTLSENEDRLWTTGSGTHETANPVRKAQPRTYARNVVVGLGSVAAVAIAGIALMGSSEGAAGARMSVSQAQLSTGIVRARARLAPTVQESQQKPRPPNTISDLPKATGAISSVRSARTDTPRKPRDARVPLQRVAPPVDQINSLVSQMGPQRSESALGEPGEQLPESVLDSQK